MVRRHTREESENNVIQIDSDGLRFRRSTRNDHLFLTGPKSNLENAHHTIFVCAMTSSVLCFIWQREANVIDIVVGMRAE